ncbi:MAG: outer membrane protein assembly factor BamE [Pseudomonadota bacterium]
MKRFSAGLAVCVITMLVAGCAQYSNKRGVEVTWQDTVTQNLVPGKSTRKDVLALLGPPSQVISLENESVLYYLFERSKGNGIILIVYNRMAIETNYDRAILFFDANDVLTDYATKISDSDQG